MGKKISIYMTDNSTNITKKKKVRVKEALSLLTDGFFKSRKDKTIHAEPLFQKLQLLNLDGQVFARNEGFITHLHTVIVNRL